MATTMTAPRQNVSIEPTVTLITVTPDLALNWLEHTNSNNRRVKETYANRLARDMRNGDWVLTHEGIGFDTDGVLIDGQHRLWAVVYAGIPVQMHIWRNVTKEALMAIGCGKSRSVGDILTINGAHGKIGRDEISVLRSMLGGLAGTASLTLTASEAAEALDRHRGAIGFAISAVPRVKRITTADTRGVVARAYYSVYHEQLRIFGRMLAEGVVPEPGFVAVVLLRQFLADACSTGNTARIERYAKTERALVAFLARERFRKLFAASKEHFPLPEELVSR